MDEKFRVYAVAIPDTEEAFLSLTGSVAAWDEVTTDATTAEIADIAIEQVRNWWQSL